MTQATTGNQIGMMKKVRLTIKLIKSEIFSKVIEEEERERKNLTQTTRKVANAAPGVQSVSATSSGGGKEEFGSLAGDEQFEKEALELKDKETIMR